MEKTAINELDARYRDALRHILISGGLATMAGGAAGLLSSQTPSPRPTRLRIPTAPPVIKLPGVKKDEEEAVKAAGLFGLAKHAGVMDSASNAISTISGATAAGDKAIGSVVNPALGTVVESVPDVLKSDVKSPLFSILGMPLLTAALGGGAMLGRGVGRKVRTTIDRRASRSRLADAKKDYEEAIAAQLGKTASDNSIEFGDLYEKAAKDGIMSKLLPSAWQTPGGGRLEGEAGQNLRQLVDAPLATGLAAAVPMGFGMYSLMKSYGMAHGRKKLVQKMLDEEARRRLARNAPKVTVELDG